jgi:YfiR/HmsC-like
VAILIVEIEALNLEHKIRSSPRNPLRGIREGRVRRLCSRIVAAALALLLSIEGVGWASAQSYPTSEYQVKAAFLFHFAQFVDWPPEAFKDAASPLTYCTAGEDPFHGALEASLNGKMIGARTVRVIHFRQLQEIQGCQIVFLGTPEKKLISAMLENLRASPILTVGESEDFVQGGGMIGFFLEDNKVRFDINLDAAERAKLKISARLLALAKTVVGGPKGT